MEKSEICRVVENGAHLHGFINIHFYCWTFTSAPGACNSFWSRHSKCPAPAAYRRLTNAITARPIKAILVVWNTIYGTINNRIWSANRDTYSEMKKAW